MTLVTPLNRNPSINSTTNDSDNANIHLVEAVTTMQPGNTSILESLQIQNVANPSTPSKESCSIIPLMEGAVEAIARMETQDGINEKEVMRSP